MTELFINGQRADIDRNTVITFNYSAQDTDNPTAVKSTYSKTVELLGTENNNRIFNNIFDLRQHSLTFHSNKRTPFVLYSGGKQQRGYLKLDSVQKNTDGVVYRCTLVGEISDFFFNLAYNDKGEKRTFASLRYYFTDESGKAMGDREDTHPIFTWDKDYITGSWSELYAYSPDSPTVNPRHVITAAPVYHGYAEDTDCKKMLVWYDSLTPEQKNMIPLPSGYDIYDKTGGWFVMENSREMDEFEARDLKSYSQCPAVKCSFLLDAISREENNGGYRVVWDDEITNSPYYQDTWVIMPKIDFGENAGEADFPFTGIDVQNPYDGYSEAAYPVPTEAKVDLSSLDSVNLSLTLNLQLTLDKPYDNLYTSYKLRDDSYYVYGGFAIRLKVMSSSGTVYSRTHFLTTKTGDGADEGFDWGSNVTDIYGRLAREIGCEEKDITVQQVDFAVNDAYATLKEGVDITMPVPSGDGIKVEMLIKYVQVNDYGKWRPMATRTGTHEYVFVNYQCTPMLVEDNTNGIYGSVPPKLQRTTVRKKTLFASLCSPFDFLLSFVKLMGLKVIPEGKRIHILPRNRYYTGEVMRLDGLVDLAKGIDIEPVLTQYKWHKYGVDTPESYAGSLYKKKTDNPYGQLMVDTGYQFNNDTKEIMQGVVFENAIPYMLNSIYFNDKLTPTPMLSPTFNVEFFDSGTDVKTVGGLSLSEQIYRVYDSMPKLCLFDKDYKQSDFKNILAFFTGMDNTREYYVSDALQECEDYAGGQCYIYNPDGLLPNGQRVTVKADAGIPCFTKYKADSTGKYTFSLDFKKPEYTFLGDDSVYSESSTIYERFFKRYVEDMYNPENRKVTLSCFLHGEPNELLRRFYYFDGAYWVMEKLSDYCYTSDIPQKVTLVRINNTANYTDNELVFMKDVVWEDKTRGRQREPQMNGWENVPIDEVTVYLYVPSQIEHDMNYGTDYETDNIPSEPNLIDEFTIPKGTPVSGLELPKPRENENHEFVRWVQIYSEQERADYNVHMLAVYRHPDRLPKPADNQIVYGADAKADIVSDKMVSHTYSDGVGVVTLEGLDGVLDDSVRIESAIDTLKLPDSIRTLSMSCLNVEKYVYLNDGLENIAWTPQGCPFSVHMYGMELPSTLKAVSRLPMSMVTIELPDGVTEIPRLDSYGYMNWNRTLHVRLGKGIAGTVEEDRFIDAGNLTSIVIAGDVTEIPDGFLNQNNGAAYNVSIQLPSTISAIANNAFDLENSVTLYYPKTVQEFMSLGYSPRITNTYQAVYVKCKDGEVVISDTGTEIR